MDFVSLPVHMAPLGLNQPILPNWGFSLFNINLGTSSNPKAEHNIINHVGSYGTQIGHLAEALEVVITQLNLLESKDLTQAQTDALRIFLADVSKVRGIKKSA